MIYTAAHNFCAGRTTRQTDITEGDLHDRAYQHIQG
jgi:hypothetical protein